MNDIPRNDIVIVHERGWILKKKLLVGFLCL